MYNSNALGSPGEARTFYYQTKDETKNNNSTYPSILVSGDDDGNLYLFDYNNDKNTWGDYKMKIIYKTVNSFSPYLTPVNAPTVGKPVVMDVNDDGSNEIIVAGYHDQTVVVLQQDL